MMAVLTGLLLVLVVRPASSQEADRGPRLSDAEFRARAAQVAGVYEFAPDHHLVVMAHTDLRLLSMLELESGLARPLEPAGDDAFVYGPSVVATAPVEGRITLRRGADGDVDEILWEAGPDSVPALTGTRVPMRREAVRFQNGDRADLAGWLITPPDDAPHPLAVILQPGSNDRFKLWRVAMALALDDVGVLVFDRRDAGESTGMDLPSHYWTAAQELAGDGVAAVRFARSQPRVDPERVGVVGWSGGGWLGALVANRDEDLAFYVNIAGNSNPGWEQNRWNKLSSLRWEGFDDEAIADAENFLDTHFRLMHGEATWAEYRAAVEARDGRPWFDWMKSTFGLWDSEAEARGYAELERDNVPERDFAGVSAPTLGIFFEFDESNPPESPWLFLRGRARGAHPDVTVRILPNTTHEALVVRGFPTADGQSEIQGFAPELYRELRAWIGERVR